MNHAEREPGPKRSLWLWVIYLNVLIAMVAFNLHLRSLELSLIDQRDQLQSQRQQQAEQASDLEELLKEVRIVAGSQSAEIRKLKRMFRDVKSQEQFLVTTGERVVWSMKRFTDRGERVLWFYVPAGNHRLVYSINQFSGDGYYARSAKAKTGDHRGLLETAAVSIGEQAVYQLRVVVDPTDGRRIQVGLSGDNNDLFHQATHRLTYPARISLGNLQNDSEDMIAYPGELRSPGDAMSHVSAKKSDPVSGMMTLLIDDLGGRGKESQGRVVMRFWIDSGSVGCVSDVNVALRYKFLSNMKQAFNPATQQDFERTFKPYDESGRYYFRDDYFPQATPVTGMDLLPVDAN